MQTITRDNPALFSNSWELAECAEQSWYIEYSLQLESGFPKPAITAIFFVDTSDNLFVDPNHESAEVGEMVSLQRNGFIKQ